MQHKLYIWLKLHVQNAYADCEKLYMHVQIDCRSVTLCTLTSIYADLNPIKVFYTTFKKSNYCPDWFRIKLLNVHVTIVNVYKKLKIINFIKVSGCCMGLYLINWKRILCSFSCYHRNPKEMYCNSLVPLQVYCTSSDCCCSATILSILRNL